jgi:hypothetical protein
VLVLAQNNYATGWLPFNARLSSAPATVLYPASTAHPVTRGLPDGALRFWRPDHTVVRVAVEPGDGVAARLLADYPVPALAEILHGGGIYLLSQIELEPALGIEPMAEKLLSRMTGYLCNQVADTENATTLIASTGSRFSRALAERGARLEATRPNLDPAFLTSPSPPAAVPPSGPPVAGPSATGTRQLLWDATTVPLERDAWLRLDPWIKSGGRLVLHGLDADAIRRLAEWTSLPLSPVTPATAATPAAGPVTLLDDPLNRGIGMASLAFGDKGQPHPRQYPALTTTTLTATPVPIPGLRPATAPAMVWGTLAWGAGQIVFDQSRWEDETLKIAEAGRFASALLTNLGLRFASLPITAEPGGWHPLDLRPAFNAVIETEYNKNYPDRQNVDAGLLLRGDWPRGRQTLQGVLFDIADPRTVPAGRNLIRINTANTTAGGVRIESFPGGARSVRVTVPAVNAARLAFLHTALHLWGDRFGQFSAAAGSRMWDYEIDYESGRRVRIPVLADRHSGRLRDGGIADKPEARLSFSSTDETGEQTAYYEMQWRNPTPEDKITGITIIGGNNPAKMPVVLAISYQAWEHTFQ